MKVFENKNVGQSRTQSGSFKLERERGKRRESELISPWDFNYNDEMKG
jgi:hypothetical protein